MVPAAIALVIALSRIRDRRGPRYVALVLSLAVAAGYIVLDELTFPEAFHFIEYGLLGLLFYRVWRPLDDAGVVVLPLLAATIAGTVDEWFQWFIPIRSGELRDIALNVIAAGCGVLFAIAVDPPSFQARRLQPASSRVLGWLAAAVAAVLMAFVGAVHTGYEIVDSEIGTFVSRYSYAELLRERDAHAARWRTDPPVALRRLSREDQYLNEGIVHVVWRNRMWSEGKAWAAWRENRILETYFAPVLDTPSYRGMSGHRWPPAQRVAAAEQAAGDTSPYVSEAYPVPMYTGPRPSALLVLKLLIVPALVVAITLAVRRWGPAFGGWLSGLPIVAGPVLVFYAIEQGTAFASEAARATLAGMSATAAFAVAYAHVSVRFGWAVSVGISWIVFAAATLALYTTRPGLAASMAVTVGAAVLGARLLPRVAPERGPVPAPPRADLIVRLCASAALVLALTGLAERFGPLLSGLLTAFPILTTTISAFTHVQRGSAAVVAFFRGFLPAIVGFAVFCFAFSLAVPAFGTALGVVTALAVQLAVHGVILMRVTR